MLFKSRRVLTKFRRAGTEEGCPRGQRPGRAGSGHPKRWGLASLGLPYAWFARELARKRSEKSCRAHGVPSSPDDGDHGDDDGHDGTAWPWCRSPILTDDCATTTTDGKEGSNTAERHAGQSHAARGLVIKSALARFPVLPTRDLVVWHLVAQSATNWEFVGGARVALSQSERTTKEERQRRESVVV